MKVDQFIAWHASVLPSGDVVRCDRRGNVPISEIARARLHFVVRADRESFPSWRWVPHGFRVRPSPAWMHPSIELMAKRVLRWERRQ